MASEIYYPSYLLERGISNFVTVWISVVVSLCYCYFLAKFIPKGVTRLFSFIPIFSLLLALPLILQPKYSGGTGFLISWLSNFKLLLLAFGKGPLSNSSLSLPHFICIACLPIRIPENQPPKSNANLKHSLKSQTRDRGRSSQNSLPEGNNGENAYPRVTKNEKTSIWNHTIKLVLVAFFIRVFQYNDHIHPKVMLVIYFFRMYFMLEIILAIAAAASQAIFGVELEPSFDKPHLSTSVQNFWGRRWNLVVSSILRSTVYEPALCVSTKLIGRKWASLPAVMCAFVISALMHEILLYYMSRMQPTWEMSWFFLLNGACVVVEIWIKKLVNHRWHLPQLISTPLTIGFVMVTGFWLLIPQLLRSNMNFRQSTV